MEPSGSTPNHTTVGKSDKPTGYYGHDRRYTCANPAALFLFTFRRDGFRYCAHCRRCLGPVAERPL